MIKQDFLLPLPDDGLITPEVGPWVEDKYRLVSIYDRLFSTGMKRKWDCRVYIDLFAGAGRSRIRGTKRIMLGSPLLALSVPDKFDKYIFCEENPVYLEALKRRVQGQFPEAIGMVKYVLGDSNAQIERICREIPQHSRTKKVLSFCFIDPYDTKIEFATIQRLGSRLIDFLLLLAVDMDAVRNEALYTRPDHPRIDLLLGTTGWRERWDASKRDGQKSFRAFLIDEYTQQMKNLGYLPPPPGTIRGVRSDEKNLPLYLLAFFTKHPRGHDFWKQTLRYATEQIAFDF
jgi:three-Cys-motif partner protein